MKDNIGQAHVHALNEGGHRTRNLTAKSLTSSY